MITIASALNPRRMRCHRIPTSKGRGVATPLPCVHHSANVVQMKSDLPGYPFGSSPRALVTGKEPFHPPFKG